VAAVSQQFAKHNKTADGTVLVESEYLEVVATRK